VGLLAVAILIFQPLFFYRRHLFSLTAHVPFDLGEYHLPLTAFIERSVVQHQWPFWNPGVYCGMPFSADITAALFYPFTWLAILADVATGGNRLFYWMEWLLAIHMIIAGVGTYYLLRDFRCSTLVALLGATVYQIGPFFVSQAQHLGAVCTAAWFPIILLSLCRLANGFKRRWVGAMAAAVALTILSGFPAAMIVVLFSSFLFATLLIWARRAKPRLLASLAAGYAAGAAIAAVQLIPTARLSSLSVASLRYKWFADGGGLPLESLVSFVWPNYFRIFNAWDPKQYTLPYNFTFLYTFCGYAAVVLVLLAFILFKKVKPIAVSLVLTVISAVWMLGQYTPVYPAIYRWLPHFLQNPLYPEFALIAFSFFTACTAALALSHLERRIPRWLVWVIVFVNSWNLLRVGANRAFNTFAGSYRTVTATWSDNGLQMPIDLRDMTRTSEPPSRVDFFSDAAGLLQSAPGIFDIASSAGDSPFLLLRYFNLRRTYSNDPEWSRRQFPRDLSSAWIRAINTGYMLENGTSPSRELDTTRYEQLPLQSIHAYRVKDPLPRFYVQNRVVPAASEEDAVRRAKNDDFNPSVAALVENLPKNWMPDQTAQGTVKVLRYENNAIDLDVQTSGQALLVTSEAYYPGWTATLNSRSVPILPTNIAFRGIPLNPGENRVMLRYSPDGFYLSLGITLVGLAIVIWCFL
jgi:hypothetical protein